MTKNAKRWIELDEQQANNEKKATKYFSGYHYNRERYEIWNKKAETAREKQNNLLSKLSQQDKEDIENYYQCGQMFDH